MDDGNPECSANSAKWQYGSAIPTKGKIRSPVNILSIFGTVMEGGGGGAELSMITSRISKL